MLTKKRSLRLVMEPTVGAQAGENVSHSVFASPGARWVVWGNHFLPSAEDSCHRPPKAHPSTISTVSLCFPVTKTCHMDAFAYTGTVTKGVTAPVALLLPCNMIYGTFPHLTYPVDAGTMQGVLPHLPAFMSQGRTTWQCVCLSTRVCIDGGRGISWAFKNRYSKLVSKTKKICKNISVHLL